MILCYKQPAIKSITAFVAENSPAVYLFNFIHSPKITILSKDSRTRNFIVKYIKLKYMGENCKTGPQELWRIGGLTLQVNLFSMSLD